MAQKTISQPRSGRSDVRALLLPRVSTLRQAEEGTSLITQEREMRQYAESRRYAISACEHDAYTGTDLYRPALNEARRLMREGLIDVIIIYAYDRFFRKQVNQTLFLYECQQYGVTVEAVTEKLDDSASGRLSESVLGAVAEFERAKIIERTMRGRRERVEGGRLNAGSSPLYGYRWIDGAKGTRETHDRYEIDEEVAPIIRYIFEQIAAGTSIRAIARYLNEQQVATPANHLVSLGYKGNKKRGYGEWSNFTVHHIAKNPAYMGRLRHFVQQREDTIHVDEVSQRRVKKRTYSERPEEEHIVLPESTCPAIVEQALWMAVQKRLTYNRETAARSMHDKEGALLSRGHIFCGHCQRPASTTYRTDQADGQIHYRYRCSYTPGASPVEEVACSHGFTHATHSIDEAVWGYIVQMTTQNDKTGSSFLEEIILQNVNTRREQKTLIGGTLTSAKKALADKERERKNLEQAFTDAMKREYNATHVDRLQELLDKVDKDIAAIKESQAETSDNMTSLEQEDKAALSLIEQLRKLSTYIKDADWKMKRRWLYFLGVKVYVYRKGVDADGQGHRWRVKFDGAGFKQTAEDVLEHGVVVSSSSRRSKYNYTVQFPEFFWDELPFLQVVSA